MSLKHDCCGSGGQYLTVDLVRKSWYIPFFNPNYDNTPDEISIKYCPWCGKELPTEDLRLISDLTDKRALLESQGNYADVQMLDDVLELLNA